jgi:hypothetical protein
LDYFRGGKLTTAELKAGWQTFARELLEDAVAQRGLSPRDLSALLATRGMRISQKVLSRKIGRGTFDAGFFLAVLTILGATEIEIQGERVGDAVLEPELTWKKGDRTPT